MINSMRNPKAAQSVLVVEDNALNMELVTDLLEAAGFTVYQAATAELGIDLARTALPHLILMDIALPGMDGLEATEKLKQNSCTRHIPVIALTAHAMKGDREKALESGCVSYITKPINTRTLVEQISAFFMLEQAA